MKKIMKITFVTILILIGAIALFFLVILISSRGKLSPLKDSGGKIIEGSLSEKGFTTIGGIQQGFFIRSENPQNPVVLFLHGGPGSPELPLIMPNEKSERPEKYFTMCYWEQRGAGMTYSSSENPAGMTVERMVEDTREMTEYLQKRFSTQKIYLVGHSWGSYLGIKTIQKYPQLYAAYIGIGQVTNQHESEILAYDYMMTHAKEIGDKDAIKRLSKFDKNDVSFPTNEYLIRARTPIMNNMGIGIAHTDFSMTKTIFDMLFFSGYTFGEKIKLFSGMGFSLVNVFHYITSDNMFISSSTFEIPVYIVQGKYDYQVSHDLAQKYLSAITAPSKDFYSFEHSAHSPNIEEPELFVQILRKIAAIHVN